MKYKTKKNENLKIFGKNFVERNKNNFKMEIDNNIYELNDYIDKNKLKMNYLKLN